MFARASRRAWARPPSPLPRSAASQVRHLVRANAHLADAARCSNLLFLIVRAARVACACDLHRMRHHKGGGGHVARLVAAFRPCKVFFYSHGNFATGRAQVMSLVPKRISYLFD